MSEKTETNPAEDEAVKKLIADAVAKGKEELC